VISPYSFANAASDAWEQNLGAPVSTRPRLVGPNVIIASDDEDAVSYGRVLSTVLGTQGSSIFLDPAVTLLSLGYLPTPFSRVPGVAVSLLPYTYATQRRDAVQDAVSDIRRISGLSVKRLTQLFPIQHDQKWQRLSEKGFYRWASGEVTPSEANLERLMSLRSLLKAVAGRTVDVRTWLLTPDLHGEAPFDLLVDGKLTRVLECASALPVRPGRHIQDADGTPGLQMVDVPFDRSDHQEDFAPDSADDWDDE
jgi:hypothetical protein